jgi:signal transduction histidine kinase
MTLGSNLSLRIIAILLGGFVLLQVTVFALTTFPGAGGTIGPEDLPRPAALAAMVRTMESTPADQRPALLDAFNGSLYTVSVASSIATGGRDDLSDSALAQTYRQTLDGRSVALSGRKPLLRAFGRRSLWPGRILSPLTLAIGLRTGGTLVVDSRPSALVRTFLNRRAFLGASGGLIVLIGLVLAIRQTTRPLSRLSQNIRAFAGKSDAPSLPMEGSREMRELAQAYNEMKERIAGLIAERTRILAAVAHDMRTYLTRLRLRVEFIDDETQRSRATADLGEMSALLDDTLLFAGDETAGTPLQWLDLAEELENIVATRCETGDAVRLGIAAGRIATRANRIALRRMLANLIDNGLRHGNRVELAAGVTPEGAIVEVRDDGPGVPPQELARLGMPFQRLDPSRDRQTGGAGLGLAIVRALATRQGALVQFANQAPRGFVARIVFPLDKDKAS